ncbi:MAG: hypothetical protein C5B50_21090 [Verrucomicrobia bacterium]|nr:MAG: hypothetical protein C5B50_21090 [Verrucomicrobiota bacterium]
MSKALNRSSYQKPVKRMLRCCATQEYFNGGGWTSNPDEAQAFNDIVEAAEICVRHQLSGVELILRYNGAVSDVFCTSLR